MKPMTEREAQEYGPQWGSYINSGDPGYIMYTRIPPEQPGHRDDMVHYLEHYCKRLAEPADVVEIDRMCAYLRSLEYPA